MSRITERIHAWRTGDTSGFDALVPEVRAELRRITGRLMREQSASHTLQPAALATKLAERLAGP